MDDQRDGDARVCVHDFFFRPYRRRCNGGGEVEINLAAELKEWCGNDGERSADRATCFPTRLDSLDGSDGRKLATGGRLSG